VDPTLFDELLASAGGDVRNAVMSLQFRALGHQQPEAYRPGQAKAAKKGGTKAVVMGGWGVAGNGKGGHVGKGKGEEQEVQQGSRDSQYSIFHSVGKVLYAKRDVEPEEIVERSDCSGLLFTEFLHRNYIRHLPPDDIELLAEVADNFSDADLLSQASKQKYGNSTSAVPESFCSSVACRGFLVAKPETGEGMEPPKEPNRGFNPTRGPQSTKVDQAARHFQTAVHRRFWPTAAEPVGLASPSLVMTDAGLFRDVLPHLACIACTSPSQGKPC
jgi:hypothetical protein